MVAAPAATAQAGDPASAHVHAASRHPRAQHAGRPSRARLNCDATWNSAPSCPCSWCIRRRSPATLETRKLPRKDDACINAFSRTSATERIVNSPMPRPYAIETHVQYVLAHGKRGTE